MAPLAGVADLIRQAPRCQVPSRQRSAVRHSRYCFPCISGALIPGIALPLCAISGSAERCQATRSSLSHRGRSSSDPTAPSRCTSAIGWGRAPASLARRGTGSNCSTAVGRIPALARTQNQHSRPARVWQRRIPDRSANECQDHCETQAQRQASAEADLSGISRDCSQLLRLLRCAERRRSDPLVGAVKLILEKR
jgi:hypothetical protein